jgi:site-specific recombinase XerC
MALERRASVLYGAGLRRTELTRFNLSRVESNHLMLFGKGRQWRQAQLGVEASAGLENWLVVRGNYPSDSQMLTGAQHIN